MRNTATCAMLALGQLLIGCTADDEWLRDVHVVRDSAGVTVVENGAPEWTEETAWRLSAAPTLSIGLLDGPLEYLFTGAHALRLDDGRILVGDAGTSELRLYDAGGTHLWTTGRDGDGPGEFRTIRGLWPLGSDSVVVWDGTTRLMHVVGLDGTPGRAFRLSEMEGARAPTPLGILGDSLVLAYADLASVNGAQMRGRWHTDRVYVAYTLTGGYATTFMMRNGPESWTEEVGDRIVIGGLAHGAKPIAVPFADGWYFGTSVPWEVERYSSAGVLTDVFKVQRPRRAIPEVQSVECYPERLRRIMAETPSSSGLTTNPPVLDSLAAYRALVVSSDGGVWAEHDRVPCEQPRWSFLQADGHYLGDVETPLNAVVQQIGEDFLLVVQSDELEVERVQLYDLIKP